MTNQILETQAIEMLELTDTDLMAVNGGIAFLPFLAKAGTLFGKGAGYGAGTYVGYKGAEKASEAIFG